MILGMGWENWLVGGGGWWGLDGGDTVPMEGIGTLSRAVSFTHHKGKLVIISNKLIFERLHTNKKPSTVKWKLKSNRVPYNCKKIHG